MCFFSQQSKSAVELKNRFKADFEEEFTPSLYNGFLFPKTPVITNFEPEKIKLYHWGLIPFWAKDLSIRKNTLNAKIETIKEKPSYKYSVTKRCLVLVDGFYEWQWLDEKGKKKQKYLITLPDKEAFALGGLYSEWVDKSTGEVINSYTILTTKANKLMSEIHNSKKRMPVILDKSIEKEWLLGKTELLNDVELVASKV